MAVGKAKGPKHGQHLVNKRHRRPQRLPKFLRALDHETARANTVIGVAERFDPVHWDYSEEFQPDDIVMECDEGLLSNLVCPHSELCLDPNGREPHLDCLVVAVDGACSGNGKQHLDVKAGIGVYFGSASSANIRASLPSQISTNQRAELVAPIVALARIRRLMGPNGVLCDECSMNHVIIKTDSNYVVRGMTEWMGKWQKNGFRTDRRAPVANSDLFQLLGKMVTLVQDTLACTVYFWHVPRAFNKEADKLAKESLIAGAIEDLEMEL